MQSRNANVTDNEILVYIRRLSRTAPASVPSWDYFQMASLPTNDNPRYSHGNDRPEPNQDILTEYYYRVKLGPSDIKFSTGPYPKEIVLNIDNELELMQPLGLAQVKIYDSGNAPLIYYWKFSTTPDARDAYIPYRNYQLGSSGDDDFISYTGIPEVRFKKTQVIDALPINEAGFNGLPELPSISGSMIVLPQSGILRVYDTKNEESIKKYELTYPETYEYYTLKSLVTEISDVNLSPLRDGASRDGLKNYPPNLPVVVANGVVEDLNGVLSADGTTYERRRDMGVQMHKIPLHELTQFRYAGLPYYNRAGHGHVDCKSTHLAYRIGAVDLSAPMETWKSDRKVISMEYNPAVFLFTSNTSFYQRLPECWPWSCRRWTIERKLDTYNKTVTKYYKEDDWGNKIDVTSGEIPRFKLEMNSFIGSGSNGSEDVAILNGDPSPPTETNGYQPPITPTSKNTYINGYLFSKTDMSIEDLNDDEILSCGCEVRDAKMELATEIFPVLDNRDAQCKLIMKLGFLCYPTKECTVPNVGAAAKKIIYPFNSCRFNDDLSIDLLKLEMPDITIDEGSSSVSFGQTQGALLSYFLNPTLVNFDPYHHPSGETESLDGGPVSVTLTGPTSNVYLIASARFPCKYTTDIYVFRKNNESIEQVNIFPLNEIHDCPTDYLAKVKISGNGTDYPEEASGVITGGDYFISENKKDFWNACDQDYSTEIYTTTSLGNAKGYIDQQNTCCDFCADEGVYVPNENCFELDIETTPSSISQYQEAGSCGPQARTRCDTDKLYGKSLMKIIAAMGTHVILEGESTMDIYTNFYGDGVIN